MNERFKFRVYDEEREEYTYSCELDGGLSAFFDYCEEMNANVEQFTGLSDMHGVDVYAGDVLIFSKWNYIVRVIWSKEICGFYMQHHGKPHDSCGCNDFNLFNSKVEHDGGYEIIGHIQQIVE